MTFPISKQILVTKIQIFKFRKIKGLWYVWGNEKYVFLRKSYLLDKHFSIPFSACPEPLNSRITMDTALTMYALMCNLRERKQPLSPNVQCHPHSLFMILNNTQDLSTKHASFTQQFTLLHLFVNIVLQKCMLWIQNII